MRSRRAVTALVFLILLAPQTTLAQSSWGPSGVALCTDPAVQSNPVLCTDDSLGAIVAWRDFRFSASGDIFAARVLADGTLDPRWGANGLAVCDTANVQKNVVIASDGSGGAFIAWEDERTNITGNIFAVHLLSDGSVAPGWTVGGNRVCALDRTETNPTIVSDGAGGAIVAWQDSRSMQPSIDIYAQHLKANEVDHLWQPSGRDLSIEGGDQTMPISAADGAGGAFIAWQDGLHLGAWHVDASGNSNWGADGVVVNGPTGNQSEMSIAGDGQGDAYFVWLQTPNSVVSVQKIRFDAVKLWTSNGVVVPAPAGFAQSHPTLTSDLEGGVIVTWSDARSGTSADVWASHILNIGSLDPTWTANGVSIAATTNSEDFPIALEDGDGGAIIEWQYGTSAGGTGARAQRIHEDGTIAAGWPAGGFTLSSVESSLQQAVIADGGGGALVAWQDKRAGANGDIYVQRVDGTGVPVAAGPAPTLSGAHLGMPWPNPARSTVALSYVSQAPITRSEVFDTEGRIVRRLATAGEREITWDLRSTTGRRVPAGLYFIRVDTPSGAESRKLIVEP